MAGRCWENYSDALECVVMRPNVVVFITDDLAYGDLACHGNRFTYTPHLDALHAQSVRLAGHRSGPVCTPARVSLMTGRYHLRTGAIDTYCGRSLMHPDEVTLVEVLRDSGYRTGIFGKWHLGDNCPMRAMDKGFEESLVHAGGGLRQPSNWWESNGYFDPGLLHNGELVSSRGYCADVFTEAAIAFMQREDDRPFFVYLATNTPHSPVEIENAWADRFRAMGVSEKFAGYYAMVENIDANVGKVMRVLDELKIAEDTIVLFTSDHGPCNSSRDNGVMRFNAGLRGIKGEMYEGGVRVPALWRWPARLKPGDIGRGTHVIDVMPTIAAACGATLPGDRVIDGVNLLPAMEGKSDVPVRATFMQWHRGDAPVRYRNYAVMEGKWKLTRPTEEAADELYDLEADPSEKRDVAAANPVTVRRLRDAYDAWLDEVSAERGEATFDVPRIHVGDQREKVTALTRQDWRVTGADGWSDQHQGKWEVFVCEAGEYEVRVKFTAMPGSAEVSLTVNGDVTRAEIPGGAVEHTFHGIRLSEGAATVMSAVTAGDTNISAKYLICRQADSLD